MNGEFLDKMSAKMGEILELTGMNGKIPPRTADIVEYTRVVKGLVNTKTIDLRAYTVVGVLCNSCS